MKEWIKINDNLWHMQWSKNRTIILRNDDSFHYTFSCGNNSEYSFSGCFFNTTIKSLDEAKAFLNKFIPLWFSDSTKSCIIRKKLKDSITVNI